MLAHSRSVNLARRRWRCMADSATPRGSEAGSTGVWHAPHLLRWMAAIAALGMSASRSVGCSGPAWGAKARDPTCEEPVAPERVPLDAQPTAQNTRATVAAGATRRKVERSAIELELIDSAFDSHFQEQATK